MRASSEPIAIIGVSCVFPGAPNLNAFWRLALEGRSALSDAPAHRLPLSSLRPESADPAHFYTRRGGFIDRYARFSPLEFGVMPLAAQGAEPDQLMSLKVCTEALLDAGYDPLGKQGGRTPSQNTQVILGRGGYIGPAMTNLNLRVRTLEQLELTLREATSLSAEERASLRARLAERLAHYGPDTAIGLVPNLCAARVAQRLNFTGPAYTLDAACASSLIAVERACDALTSGRADLALAGGVHLVHDLTFWSVFTQLGALSRAEQLRPFDQRADGLLIGEGLGVVALKRYSDALRDGDRIYALVRGAASSSDGRVATLMSPSSQGQLRAVSSAWEGLNPKALGLVEAHATATPLGDQTELETLRAFFGERHTGEALPFGTLKALIGHTMPASGVAALIKASLALYHGVTPPSGAVEAPFEPHPSLERSRLAHIERAVGWAEGLAPRAAVNAFGFGGSNAHLVLESPELFEHSQRAHVSALTRARPLVSHLSAPRALLAFASPTLEGLCELISSWVKALEENELEGEALEGEQETRFAHLLDERGLNQSHQSGEGEHRAALLDPTPKRLRELERAVREHKHKRGRGGLWHTPLSARLSSTPKLTFLYPGVEATFAPHVASLCAQLGLPAPPLPRHKPAEGASLSQEELAARGVSVVRLGLTLTAILRRLGLEASEVAGHSVGEWTALVSAGYLSEEKIEDFIGGLDPQGLEVPEVSFIAAGAPRERVEALIGAEEGVYCSHDNCPHQSVFCVPRARADELTTRLLEAQVLAQRLPFESGFHAPYFKPYAARITEHLRGLELQTPQRPLWSATTCEPYPLPTPSPEPLYELSDRHLTEPVRFRELTERLYAEGSRLFVQLGLGSLASFVSDTLRGRPHLALESHSERLGAWEQLTRLCAALFVEGVNPHISALTPIKSSTPRDLTLKLGVPLISLKGEAMSAEEVTTPREARALTAQPLVEGKTARSTASSPITSQLMSSPQAWRPSDVGAWRGVGTLPAPLTRAEHKRTGTTGTTGHKTTPQTEGWSAIWPLSVAQMPYLIDHCFFRQPPRWPVLRDRFPVVPMTLSLQWAMEAAKALIDEQGLQERVVGLERARASKWVEVEPAVEVEVSASVEPPLERPLQRGELRRVKVTLQGHLSVEVLLSAQPLPAPPSPPAHLNAERPAPITASQVYTDRWMFHGPAYEGIARLDALSPQGIRGLLRATHTPGALLDNVGQLFGLWVMLTEREDRVVMPVSLESLRFYGPPPAQGELLSCVVWVEELTKRDVTAHMALWRMSPQGPTLWATLKGWRDWRFETSGALWGLMRYPERDVYARPLPAPSELTSALQGVSLTFAEGVSASASSREFLVGRCLNQEEQVTYRAASLRAQQGWLAGRIAAKDAARLHLWRLFEQAQPQRPRPALFPVEVATERDADGALSFSATGAGAPLEVSISHKGGSAVAVVTSRSTAHSTAHSTVGRLGVDLEPLEARPHAWREASFCAEERALIERSIKELTQALRAPELTERLLWTAAWCVKEARAKASREGLGSPKRWPLSALKGAVGKDTLWGEAEVSGERVWWWLTRDQAQRPFVVALCCLSSSV